jgi:hypothetical protein
MGKLTAINTIDYQSPDKFPLPVSIDIKSAFPGGFLYVPKEV